MKREAPEPIVMLALVGPVCRSWTSTLRSLRSPTMDISTEDQAGIAVLCLQARAYSKLLAAVREEIRTLRGAIRATLDQLRGSHDARVRGVAEEMLAFLDETEPDLFRILR